MEICKRLLVFAALGMTFWIPAWGGSTPAHQPQTAYQARAQSGDEGVTENPEAVVAHWDKSVAPSGHCSNAVVRPNTAIRAALGLNGPEYSCPTGCALAYCPYPYIACCDDLTHEPCR